jgi:hypothetical protein
LFPRTRLKRREENGCGGGRALPNEATPCLLLETFDYSLVSQLVRGIVCGWGNIEEKGQKKRRRRGVFRLRTVALDPNFFFYFFVHPLEGGGGQGLLLTEGKKLAKEMTGALRQALVQFTPLGLCFSLPARLAILEEWINTNPVYLRLVAVGNLS